MIRIAFETELSSQTFPWLGENVPFAVLVELALAAARSVIDDAGVTVSELERHEPIAGSGMTLEVEVVEEAGVLRLSIGSRVEGRLVRHVSGRISAAERSVTTTGPHDRSITIDPRWASEASAYNIHPLLVRDAIGHGVSRIARVTSFGPAGDAVSVRASGRDLDLVRDGAVIARFEGIERAAPEHATSDLFYAPAWDAAVRASGAGTPSTVAIVGGLPEIAGALADALEARGATTTRASSGGEAHVVYLGACEHAADRDALPPSRLAARVQDLTTEITAIANEVATTPAKLWVITNGAHAIDGGSGSPAQAAAWGIARVFSLEHRGSFGGLVDLSASATEIDALAAEILDPGPDDQIALRGDARFVLRLAKTSLAPSRTAIYADATYVVTGGLGGLGLEVASWLAERGAGQIVLVGRSAPSSDVAAKLATITARVRVATCDVADFASLEREWAAWRSELPPIRGIFHAAGIATTTPLKNLDPDAIARVARAKVLGTLNLERVSEKDPLDAFVLFSSGASVWGSRDLGHYAAASAFLDGIAHRRRARGQVATSINWGMWDEVGMSSAPETKKLLGLVGLGAMPPRTAVHAMDEAIGAGCTQIAIAAIDWTRFRRLYEAGAPRRRLLARVEQISAPVPMPAATCPPAMADACSEEEVGGFVCEALAKLIGVPIEDFDGDAPLLTLGIDSISGLDLLTSLAVRYGVRIPVSKLLEGITAFDLAALVFAALSRAPAEAKPATVSSIQLAPAKEIRSRLHPSQVGLWFLDQMAPGSALYNVPACIRIRGRLDRAALEQTIDALADRHDALRTTFGSDDGEPVAIVAPRGDIEIESVDLGHLAVDAREAEALRLARDDARRAFDLARGPLMRCTVVRLADDDHAVLLALHHIVCDGWSMGVFVRETAMLYESFASGASSPLEALPAWSYDHDARFDDAIAFWKKTLSGAPPLLSMPTDRPRPARRSDRGALAPVAIDRETAGEMRAFCKREGVTLFMLWLAAWQATLARWSGANDISVGTPVAGREGQETRGLIGLFVNPIVMRVTHAGDDTFASLLARVRSVALAGFANQDVPFDSVVKALEPARDASYTPLFQYGFVYQNAPMDRLRLGSLELEMVEIDPGVSKYDMHLTVRESDGAFAGTLEYSTDLYDASTAERLVADVRTLMKAAIASPATPLATLLDADDEARAYWAARVGALPPPPALPVPLTGAIAGEATTRSFVIDRDAFARIKAHGRARGITPSMIVCAAYVEILRRWSSDRTFSIAIEDAVLDATSCAETFTARALELQARRWADLEVPVVIDARPASPYAFTETGVASGAWIACKVVHGRGITIAWEAIETNFASGVADAMFEAFRDLLARLGDEATWSAPSLDLLPAAQASLREALVHPPLLDLPTEPAHAAFEAQVLAHPERPAVLGDRALSYGELDGIANAIARKLVATGVRQGDLVAIVMNKGWEQVAAVLGIVKAGAAYVPLDASSPDERIASLLEHARVTAVVTEPRTDAAFRFPARLPRLRIDDAIGRAAPITLARAIATDDLCYVIYTSGSTGTPKGVMVAHGGLTNTMEWTRERFDVGPSDRAFAVAALHHDLSVWDIFGVLGAGAAIVMPSARGAKDPAHWADLLRAHRVTLWNSVPPMLEMLLEHGAKGCSLRLALAGGDWISISLPERLAAAIPGARVVSIGGPTETTVWNIIHVVDEVRPEWKSIPYGRAIANARYVVLDENLEECPDWVPGHMHCAGIGIARGYLHDDAKTDEKFFVHPRTGERLYATGDQGRFWPDGTLEFLGRVDFQIKVQGYRIEPGEIEAALTRHPAIKQTIVVALGTPGDKTLVAYYVANDAAPSHDELRAHLGATLPPHMVPRIYVPLDAFPLSANGKIERKALPAPASLAIAVEIAPAPSNPIEARLVAIWEEVLGKKGIRATDDFFALGGHSLLAVRLVARIEKAFGTKIDLPAIFRSPTIAALAEMLGGGARGNEADPIVRFGGRAAPDATPFFCVHPAGGDVFCYVELAKAIASEHPLVALRAPALSTGVPEHDLREMARGYVRAIRAEQPHGPYLVGGWSMGGLVAYEIAHQLRAAGEEVALVALLDSMVMGDIGTESDREPMFFAMFVNDVLGLVGASASALGEDFWNVDRDAQLATLRRLADVGTSGLDRSRLDRMYSVFRANIAAAWAYEPASYDGPIAVLVAGDGANLASTRAAWRKVAAGRLYVDAVPGDHYSILSSGVAEVAHKLATQLRIATQLTASTTEVAALGGGQPRRRTSAA